MASFKASFISSSTRIISMHSHDYHKLNATKNISLTHVPNPTKDNVLRFDSTKKQNSINKERNINLDRHSIEELYAVKEIVSDRIEMHKNIGEQRNNWNHLLLTSVNNITATALALTGLSSLGSGDGIGAALKTSATLLYASATGILIIMNKIQPSQLAEEQRNASRLFKQLYEEIKSSIDLQRTSPKEVERIKGKVLALDKAYPLPLLGTMIDKFPKRVEPAVWWPQTHEEVEESSRNATAVEENGWNGGIEKELKAIVSVMKKKDDSEYIRLGNIVLRMNKILAVCGPLLTGLAAIGSGFMGSSDLGSVPEFVGVFCGALATVVNTVEHGGQMGMVFEMYRNSAGFFRFMEETIESNLKDRTENGEVLEARVALELGRNLSELRDLADIARSRNPNAEEEFASKLF